MPPTRPPQWPLPVAIAAASLAFVVQLQLALPPEPVPATADASVFSAERARAELARLLGDETPHPVGSAANRAVKERLLARLAELGIAAEEQRAVGCGARYAICASVENVIARIPGASEDAVALMAHYDSVEHAPGAGDDGAGVAALLEIARIARSGAPHRNSILFVFTDAEEQGLLGAEAFFAEHPLAKRVRAVVNVEGSGSGGPVFLLRSAPGSGHLLDAYRAVATAPLAQSFAEEVFARMPNDTDFSVAMRAGVTGIDFAFAGERNHYHTPLDTVANLELATLQHHGENALPLLRALANADLRAKAPTYVYANVGKRLWLAWSPATGVALAGLAVALLGFATWRARPRPIGFVGAVAAVILLAVGAGLLGAGCLWLVDRIVGTRPAWPANPWPWRIAIYAAPLALVAVLGPPLARRAGTQRVYLAVWWLWSLAALAMALALPRAANLLIPSALAAGVIGAATLARGGSDAFNAARVAWIPALAGAWFLLPLASTGEQTQGFALALGLLVPVVLVATAMLPAAVADPRRAVLSSVLAAMLFALGLATRAAPYSEQRPQHVNLIAAQPAGAARALLVAWSEEPLPEALRAAGAFVRRTPALPWMREGADVAELPGAPAPAPAIERLPDAAGFARFHVTPVAGCHAVALMVPAARIEDAARIHGRKVTTAPRRGSPYRALAFYAPPADGFVVELKLKSGTPRPAYLIDVRSTLPRVAAPFAAARGALAVPVHSGDQAAVYRVISL